MQYYSRVIQYFKNHCLTSLRQMVTTLWLKDQASEEKFCCLAYENPSPFILRLSKHNSHICHRSLQTSVQIDSPSSRNRNVAYFAPMSLLNKFCILSIVLIYGRSKAFCAGTQGIGIDKQPIKISLCVKLSRTQRCPLQSLIQM